MISSVSPISSVERFTFFAAIGSLLIGTVLAVMRVSPVGVLRGLGAFYVNTVRNTPLTLILLFCVLGVLYVLQVPLAPADSPTSVRDNAIRWAIVGLSVYHAAFVCERYEHVGPVELARAEFAQECRRRTTARDHQARCTMRGQPTLERCRHVVREVSRECLAVREGVMRHRQNSSCLL